jgi:CMP-N,N'-diacetyllegionaminic acid synthase
MKILAIIPARGGSKGVPGKNIKLLGAKPLIAYTIEAAYQSKFLAKTILSTDSQEIIDVAKGFLVEIPFTRPKYLAEDNTPTIEVVQHAITFFEEQQLFFDAVCILQPTSPFREVNSIDKAIQKFIKSKVDTLVSVLKVPHQFNPHWVFEENETGNLKIATGESKIISRRQELPPAYYRDGSIYLVKTELIKEGILFKNKIGYIESNPEFNVNIDTIEDWQLAEKLLNKVIL